GPVGRTSGIIAGWTRHRVLPVLLPRRHLRFRRRAQHVIEERSRSAERTLMFAEAGDASNAVRAQLRYDSATMRALGAKLRKLAPRAVITCARGSSDHAATYAKYLIETHA